MLSASIKFLFVTELLRFVYSRSASAKIWGESELISAQSFVNLFDIISPLNRFIAKGEFLSFSIFFQHKGRLGLVEPFLAQTPKVDQLFKKCKGERAFSHF